MMKLAAKTSSAHVGAQLNALHLLDQKHHQCMLTKLLSSVRFLAHQGLPLCGHHDDINSLDGNLYKPFSQSRRLKMLGASEGVHIT